MPRKPSGKHSFSEIEMVQKNGEIYVYERESWYDSETRNTKSRFKLKGIRTKDGGTSRIRTATGEDTFLDGELFVEFMANSMRESLGSRIASIEKTLACPNGERTHDKMENLKVERGLLNWLRKKSFVNVMGSYRNVDIKKISDRKNTYKIVTPMAKKERLFLELLGIKLYD